MKPKTNWEKGMVACYHPYSERRDMGNGIEKCPTCGHVRRKGGYWPPAISPP